MVENKQEIASRIRHLEPQLRTHGVERLSLFGSFVRGDQGRESDVDLLVQFVPGQKTYDNFSAVGDLLQQSLQRRVELLTLESLSPFIGPRILLEAEDVVFAD